MSGAARTGELAAALGELEALLRACGEDRHAAWVARRRRRAESGDRAVAGEVRGILAGMGSLADLWLEPEPGVGLTRTQAERRRQELSARLDRLTSRP